MTSRRLVSGKSAFEADDVLMEGRDYLLFALYFLVSLACLYAVS